MLNQCSRSSPALGEGTWQPAEADVVDMEMLLPSALAEAPEAQGFDFSDVLGRWQRQYVGVVRGGKRFIYGNFFPLHPDDEFAALRERPMIVCDGGPAFFGAEYDVDADRISHLSFNGSV